MIRLVLTDLDNTLIPLGAGAVDAYTRDAIAELVASGVRFGLATGRDIAELMDIFGGDARSFETGILSNGKKIMVDGELKRLILIDRDAFARLAEEARDIPDTFVCAYPLHTAPSNPVWVFGADGDVEGYRTRYAFEPILADEVPDEEIIGATIACDGPQEQLDDIKRRFKELAPQFDIAQSGAHWCDILPAGVNKGSALGPLLAELGIGDDEVVFFGDEENDLALLTAVPNSVAVANASPAAAAAARWHIGDVADHAVADALRDIARATREGGLPSFMQD